MKRTLILSLVAVVILAMTGVSMATVWTGYLDPGDHITTNISNVNDTRCKSEMSCHIPSLTPIPHATWVLHGTSLEFVHMADLSNGQSSTTTGSINYGTAVLHWYVGPAVTNGYSYFIFEW